jgi:arylsulfatase A-like enzyme
MSPGRLTRRRFLGAASAGLAGGTAAALGLKEVAGGAMPFTGPDRRNIVLIVIDSLRADHLGCYGNRRMRTPNLDALARDSLRFTQVLPEAMPTVPARRSILTGRRSYPFRDWQPWEGLATRAGWEPIMPGTETLLTTLHRRGYWTAYVSDNPFLANAECFRPFRGTARRFVRVPGQRGIRKPESTVPIDDVLRRLPDLLRDERRITMLRRYMANNGRGEDEAEQSAARLFASAERMLDLAGRRRPFFLAVDSFDPHEFWAPTRKYLDMYGDPDYRGREIADVAYTWSDYLTEEQLERLRVTYAASVTMVDRWLGRFLEGLHDRGLEDDTVLALVSDHGVYLGDHGLTGKSESYLHPELIRVPLLLRDPDGRGSGEASDYYATTVDLAPTLMRMAGLTTPDAFEGTDLSPLTTSGRPAEERPFAYGGYGNFSFIRDERWMWVARNDRGWHQLFDLAADPGETVDVSGRRPDVVRAMWTRLLRKIGDRPPRYGTEDQRAPGLSLTS